MNTLRGVTSAGPSDAASLPMTFAAQSASLRDVLQAIQDGAQNMALAVAADGRLIGVMTDGDVRRALLGGAGLEDPATGYMSRTPMTVNLRDSRSTVLDFMRAQVINQIPIVDDDGVLVGLHTLQGLVGRQSRPNLAVILAGGRGTRLHPLTEDIPKAMVPVAGRPILERIVAHLVGYGLSDIVLAVGHLAEPIVDHFGDGSAFGCTIRYLADNPADPRGTCGPLAGLPELVGPIADPLLVMNGDLLTSVDVGALLSFHESSRPAMTIATKSLPFEIPYAVLEHENGRVVGIAEKPVLEHLCNIGIYVLDPACIELVPVESRYDMTDLADDLLAAERDVRAWPSEDDWIDIGTPGDLGRAHGQRQ